MSGFLMRVGEVLADAGSVPTGTDGQYVPQAGPLAEVSATRLGEGALRGLQAFGSSPEAVPIVHGWFHPVSSPRSRYAVVDASSGPAFASTHSRHGGMAVLGNPVARPATTADKWTNQMFDRGALGWRPDDDRVTVLPAGEFIRQSGIDPKLAEIGLPTAVPAALTAQEALHQMAWLTDPGFRDRYYQRAIAGSRDGEPIDLNPRTIGPGTPRSPSLTVSGHWGVA